jgi:aryl-alcohol dehydrogenase-like predicted oxidoreductase
MQFTRLGTSGLKVSRIALGCMIHTLEDPYTPRPPTGF